MAGSPIDPSYQFISVTPSDTAILSYTNAAGLPLPLKTKAIYVGATGNLAVLNDAGTSVTFVGVSAGVMHPISTQTVLATGTTATSLVALF